jgi:hypothetical protein
MTPVFGCQGQDWHEPHYLVIINSLLMDEDLDYKTITIPVGKAPGRREKARWGVLGLTKGAVGPELTGY